jgi:membrane protease YdiL (CAAX protease family)
MQSLASEWRGRDFILAMAGGFGGVFLAGGLALAMGADEESLLIVGSLGQFGGHLLVMALLARSRGGFKSLGFEVEPSDVVFIFYGIGLQILLPLLFAPLADLVGNGPSNQVVTEQIQRLAGTTNRVLMAGVLAVLGPVAEELLFRGILLRALAHRGRGRAAWATAGTFVAFHLFGISGDILASLVFLVPTFLVVGLILARITWRRGRLGPAIFLHSGFNLLALSVLLLPPDLLEGVAGFLALSRS